MMASEQRLRDFGRRMAEAQDAAMADGFDRDAAAARWEALLLEAPPEPRRSLVPVAAVLAVAAGLLGLVWLSMRPAPPLSVVVDAVPHAADAPLIAGASSPLSVAFSDGSALALDPEGRASIAAVDARGAALELERGRLHAAIVHRTDSRWRVRCGPFEVQVTGTRFDLAWDPGRGELAVSLFEGGVLVSGPALGGPQPVRAGERLTVSTERGEVRWGSATPGASVVDAGEPALAPAGDGASIADAGRPANDRGGAARVDGAPLMGAGEPATAPAAPAAVESAISTAPVVRAPQAQRAPEPASIVEPGSPTPEPPAPTWSARLEGGDREGALHAAEARGFERVCAEAPVDQLAALARAARLSGRAARAEQAYSALRARFPGTPDAVTAAFMLGRLAQQRGADDAAARWFEAYLEEAPAGPFAVEAEGRRIEVYAASGDARRAREAAARYLEAHPDGPHRAYAEGILRAP